MPPKTSTRAKKSKTAPVAEVVSVAETPIVEKQIVEAIAVETKPKAKRGKAKSGKPKRTFKLLLEGIEPKPTSEMKFSKGGGSYEGTSPLQAAGRAFAQLSRQLAGGKVCSYKFSIVETTKGKFVEGKQPKVFTYIGNRILLDPPRTIKRQGEEYKINYDNSVKCCRAPITDIMTTVATAVTNAPEETTPVKKTRKPVAKKAPVKKTATKKAPVKKAPVEKVVSEEKESSAEEEESSHSEFEEESEELLEED